MRKDNWPSLLFDAIAKHKSSEFKWGEHDCAMFCANVIKEYTDRDLAEAFRKEYSSHLGSKRAIKKFGAANLSDIADSIVGSSKSPSLAMRGDLILFDNGNGDTFGICAGATCVAASAKGFVHISSGYWLKAWSID